MALAIVGVKSLPDGGARVVSISLDARHTPGWRKLFWRLATDRPTFALYFDYDAADRRRMIRCLPVAPNDDWPWGDPLESHSRTLIIVSTNASTDLHRLLDEASRFGWPQEAEFYRMMERNHERDFEIIPDDAWMYFGSFGEERPDSWLLSARDPIDRLQTALGRAFPNLRRVEVSSRFFMALDNNSVTTPHTSSRRSSIGSVISDWRVR